MEVGEEGRERGTQAAGGKRGGDRAESWNKCVNMCVFVFPSRT